MFFIKNKSIEAVKFIYKFARKSKRSKTYKRQYRNIANHLSDFEVDRGIIITSENFTDNVLEDYIYFLKDKNLMLSTVSTIVDKTKYMFRRMKQEGHKIDSSIFDISVPVEQGISVYVTSEEIERIYKLKVSNEQEVARDLFVVGCLTGMRFSDYSKLTSKNIVGNTIQRKTLKTGEVVIVPIHRIVGEIILKYNGFPSYDNSLQNFNAIIKRICKKARLNEKVFTERTIGHKIVRKTFKKYELIGSHTARRSFATNAYLAGILPAKIMLITGHKTEEAFFKYIRIEKRKNAKELSEHPFFK